MRLWWPHRTWSPCKGLLRCWLLVLTKRFLNLGFLLTPKGYSLNWLELCRRSWVFLVTGAAALWAPSQHPRPHTFQQRLWHSGWGWGKILSQSQVGLLGDKMRNNRRADSQGGAQEPERSTSRLEHRLTRLVWPGAQAHISRLGRLSTTVQPSSSHPLPGHGQMKETQRDKEKSHPFKDVPGLECG